MPLESVAAAEAYLARRAPDLLLLDVKLGDGDGLVLLDKLRGQGLRTPVIVVTAFGTVERAVQALRAGAADFLVKPFTNERLVSAVERRAGGRAAVGGAGAGGAQARGARGHGRRAHRRGGRAEGRGGAAAPGGRLGGHGAGARRVRHGQGAGGPRHPRGLASAGRALRLRQLRGAALLAAGVRAVRLRARRLHRSARRGARASSRRRRAARSSWTRLATCRWRPRPGCCACCRSGEITRIGGREAVRVDIRVISATHRDLDAMAASGQFRADLLYRLAVIPIRLPPLRERAGGHPGAHRALPGEARGAQGPAGASAGRGARCGERRSTPGRATCASWRTSSSARWCWAGSTRSRSRRRLTQGSRALPSRPAARRRSSRRSSSTPPSRRSGRRWPSRAGRGHRRAEGRGRPEDGGREAARGELQDPLQQDPRARHPRRAAHRLKLPRWLRAQAPEAYRAAGAGSSTKPLGQ